MSTLQLQTYDMLKSKLGEQEAKLFISYIESKVEEEVKHETKSLASKQDLLETREGLIKEISSSKAELTRQIYIVGLIQFLAIVGSVIGIISFILHK